VRACARAFCIILRHAVDNCLTVPLLHAVGILTKRSQCHDTMPAVRPTRVASQVAMQQLVHGERVARAVRAQRAAAERAAAAARSEGAADGGADGGAAAHGAPGPAVQPTDRVRPAGSCLMTCAALLRPWLTPMDAWAVVGRLFVSLVCCALRSDILLGHRALIGGLRRVDAGGCGRMPEARLQQAAPAAPRTRERARGTQAARRTSRRSWASARPRRTPSWTRSRRPPRPRSWRRAGWSAATRRWWLPSATAGAPVRRRAPWIVWGMLARHRGWPFGWNCAASRACARRTIVNPARAKARSECGLWSDRVCVTCEASPEA